MIMKRQAIFLSYIIAVLLFYGCDKHEQNKGKPLYNANQQSVSENQSISGQIDNIKEANDIIEESNMFSPDFNGITPTRETPKGANSPFANISTYGTAPILSYDEESDTLYYVNYGGRFNKEKDNYLYSYREGVRELLVEMPVNYPNYLNGYIYFISNENTSALYAFTPSRPEGKLYRYNIVERTLELLVDEKVYNLVVYEDYIYYTTSPDGDYDDDGNYIQKGWENFRLSTTGGKPESIGEFLPFFYGEYQLRQGLSEENLRFMELVSEDKAVRITGNFEYFMEQTYCIGEDKFWFTYSENKKTHLASIDLRNGETMTYQHDSDEGIFTYTVLNGELFALSGNFESKIVRYNSEDEAFITVDLSERHAQPVHILTDGEYVYVQYQINAAKLSDTQIFLTRLIPSGNGMYEEEVIY